MTITPQERPAVLESKTHKLVTFHGGGEATQYVTVTLLDGRPFEVFATGQRSKGDGDEGAGSTSCQKADYEAICRLASLALRVDPSLGAEVIQQLRGISCHTTFTGGGERITSFADGLAHILAQYERT